MRGHSDTGARLDGSIVVRVQGDGKEFLRTLHDPRETTNLSGRIVASIISCPLAMKSLLALAIVLLLCSCASAPSVHTDSAGGAYSLGPTSASDPRLRSARFYMDEGSDLPAWTHAAGPMTNR
jgi:hypothetical protein